MKNLVFIFVLSFGFLLGCAKDQPQPNPQLTDSELELRGPTTVQEANLFQFQAAGDFGGEGNVLSPGDVFPPLGKSFATLKRSDNYLQFNIHTKGLPQGAYTVWWVIFNEPGDCGLPNPAGGVCGGGAPDLFIPSTSVLWATGGVVQANGVGNFSDRLYVGEQRDETVFPLGGSASPLYNPQGAEVHLIIKYHGLASSDPDVLHAQTHTFVGNCGGDSGANSYDLNFAPPPFSPYQCFDPQGVVFVSPEE